MYGITHHSVGLKDPPNTSIKYIKAHITVEQMHVDAVLVSRYIRRYVDAKSYLPMNMCIVEKTHHIICIVYRTIRNMKP